jgi:hypothetical protein
LKKSDKSEWVLTWDEKSLGWFEQFDPGRKVHWGWLMLVQSRPFWRLGAHPKLHVTPPFSWLANHLYKTALGIFPQSRMSTLIVVPVNVLCNVLTGLTDAVVGLQIHPLVLDGSPHPFDEHFVALCTTDRSSRV